MLLLSVMCHSGLLKMWLISVSLIYIYIYNRFYTLDVKYCCSENTISHCFTTGVRAEGRDPEKLLMHWRVHHDDEKQQQNTCTAGRQQGRLSAKPISN